MYFCFFNFTNFVSQRHLIFLKKEKNVDGAIKIYYFTPQSFYYFFYKIGVDLHIKKIILTTAPQLEITTGYPSKRNKFLKLAVNMLNKH